MSQYNLGLLYRYGRGVKQDYLEAADWYRKAAAKGYADAQNNLGVLYRDGEGVSQDYSEAYKLFTKAAKQGNEYAKRNLEKMKQNGLIPRRGINRPAGTTRVNARVQNALQQLFR